MLSQDQIIAQTITTTAVVYEKQNIIQQTPITLQIEGTRTTLRTLIYQPPQITFYREEHPENQFDIKPTDVLLPETVALISYSPRNIIIGNQK